MSDPAQPQGQPKLSAHDAAMVAKVDAASATVNQAVNSPVGGQPQGDPAKPAVAARPDHVPEKFWDAEKGQVNTEALLKSYSELEKGKPAAPQEALKAPEGDPAAEAAKAAKLDMGKLTEEFATNGAISEDSYKALEAAGFSKEVVDSYIAGQQALAEKRDQAAYALVGGQENFQAMAKWAESSLSPAEKAAFNSAVAGTPEQMKQAILALNAQYTAANGSDPKLNLGGLSGDESAKPFASRAEVTAAMRDPRYRNDPAYRAQVEKRVGLMDNF